jgi:hypothetical protein
MGSRCPALLAYALLCAVMMNLPLALAGTGGAAVAWAAMFLSALVFLVAAASAAASAQTLPGGRKRGALESAALALKKAHVLIALCVPVFIVYELLMVLGLGVGMGLWRLGNGGAFYIALPLACVLATSFLSACFCLAAPSCALEKTGPFAALARSLKLTRGSRLAAFLIFFVLFVINIVAAVFTGSMRQTPAGPYVEGAVSAALSLVSLATVGGLYRLRTEGSRPKTKKK